MGKYDLGLARKIIQSAESGAELGLKESKKALEMANKARAERLSPAAEKANAKVYEILKGKDNLVKWSENKARNEATTAKVLAKETEVLPDLNTSEHIEKSKRIRVVDAAEAKYEAQTEAELAARKNDTQAKALGDEKTKVSALGFGGAAMGSQSGGMDTYDPVNIAKAGYNNVVKPAAAIVASGYQRFEQARQSVVDKIVNLTDMTADNPHVPQYAKDTYNEAADAVVSGATDPLNYIGGAGAADAAIGAGATAYDMYSSRKPASTMVDKKPMTNPAQQINWQNKP